MTADSRNTIVQNALAYSNRSMAMNKPYDMPMDTSQSEKVVVRMEEFTHQYGQREMPRPLYTTIDKLSSYLARWGLASQEAKIRRELKKGKEYRVEIEVKIPFVFSA